MGTADELTGEVTRAIAGLLGCHPQLADHAAERLRVFGVAPNLDTRHKLTVAAVSAIGAYALAVEEWWRMGGGQRQTIGIDCLQATCALNPAQFQRQSGYAMSAASLYTELKAGFYKTADDRWFFPVGSYPHLRDSILDVLQCANTREALATAIGARGAEELEQTFADRRLPGVYARSPEEWRAHEQGVWLSRVPVIQIEKIGDSAPEFPAGNGRPLDQIRVLDMGHVIAGPVVARSLAEHGADVLRVSPPLMQDAFRQTVDTNIGKRSGFIDLNQDRDLQRMRLLIAGADVMVQSWRAGSLQKKGMGAEEAAAVRPGIVYVSVSCFGDQGPWAQRGGFEQLAQSASGIAYTEGYPESPRLVATQLLNDYVTGYLGALGAMLALMRRAQEGGSYHVKVVLTRTSMWVQGLGLADPSGAAQERHVFKNLCPIMETRASPFGVLEQLPPVAQFSRTKAYWVLPPAPNGAHETCWL